MAAARRTADVTNKTPDAWMVLVLKSMSKAELQREAANTANSEDERASMRAELVRRGVMR